MSTDKASQGAEGGLINAPFKCIFRILILDIGLVIIKIWYAICEAGSINISHGATFAAVFPCMKSFHSNLMIGWATVPVPLQSRRLLLHLPLLLLFQLVLPHQLFVFLFLLVDGKKLGSRQSGSNGFSHKWVPKETTHTNTHTLAHPYELYTCISCFIYSRMGVSRCHARLWHAICVAGQHLNATLHP